MTMPRYNPGMILSAAVRSFLVVLAALSCATLALAQLSNPNPVPFSGTVPSGSGACSVARSCAEVAPDIIKRALGPSTLQENLRHLAGAADTHAASSSTPTSEVSWAVEAFRRAGVENVHTEKFAVPSGSRAKAASEHENVVAEIRGRDLPDEFVVLAGILTSDGKASGPMDDGDTAAMVIEAARAIHASGSIPRRTIRFVLFASADQGMLGSQAYVAAHRGELDRMIAAISLNSDAGRVTGFSLGGRKDILAAVQEALAPVKSLGADEFTTDAKISSDSFDFLLDGIPTLVPNEEPENSAASHQTSEGIYDAAAFDALKHQVAIVAVAAYALSDTDRRVGSRQSRSQVQQLLVDTGLAERMKADGIWAEWENGERGRKP